MNPHAYHQHPRVSIVIPVYNKWELTEQCLLSLAQSTLKTACEVIVVDNASDDSTPAACPPLGKSLWGENFTYHRSATNLNFGPACNLGAGLARGDYLLLLNNDILHVPGEEDWLEKLLEDFRAFPDIAVTGPVLLYPPKGPLGATVQHLGVYITPFFQCDHLYEGIPADSGLVKKRRFFQVITGACALMPRGLFLEHKGFNEGYKNGFEDVDLCARLYNAGYRMTVNPEARLYHLTSQTPGRHTHEGENWDLLAQTTLSLLAPDWRHHLKGDGYELGWTPWLTLAPYMPTPITDKLAPLLTSANTEALPDVLRRYPLWHEGYTALAAGLKESSDVQGYYSVMQSLAHLRPLPEVLLPLWETALALGDDSAVQFAITNLVQFCKTPQCYIQHNQHMYNVFETLKLQHLQTELDRRRAEFDTFREQTLLPFFREFRAITRNYRPEPDTDWAYALWRELQHLPEREGWRQKPLSVDPAVTFSVLMPVYNPKPEHLREAVDSLLAQDYPHWELCMADDASPDPNLRPLLLELTALDPRIRVEFRATNGHIAAATNTAIDMARFEYAVLLDQDDLLSPDALAIVARAIQEHPGAALLYSDADKLLEDGTVSEPYLKGPWDRELLTGQNMVIHLSVYRMDRLREIGGFRDGFAGSQDYDMVLRYTRDLPDEAVVRIPRVLYHWRVHAGSTALLALRKNPMPLKAVSRPFSRTWMQPRPALRRQEFRE